MQKVIDFIKGLLGKKSSGSDSSDSSGFTLIELLIVIAVIGILAAALLIAIDPIDKIRAGNDTKVASDVRAIYDAANRAYAQNYVLPLSTSDLESSGEMNTFPTPPSSHGSYNYYADADTGNVLVVGEQHSKKRVREAGTAASAPVYFVASKDGACLLDDAPSDENAVSICP